MDVDVYDPAGRSLSRGPGELVCRPPFPSQPLGFLDDPGDARFRETYFGRFPGAWCQGDWAEWTGHGGIVIHGRSDATLNVHGVRIGTAEIYRELERFEEVVEAVAVECGSGATAGIALFVRLREAQDLDDELRARVRRALHERRSPRHVPRHIVQVADLPRTRSGKVSELAVRDALRGRTPPNLDSLANPRSLDALQGLELG
jgi:acetoacetyl-CoA synthetase